MVCQKTAIETKSVLKLFGSLFKSGNASGFPAICLRKKQD